MSFYVNNVIFNKTVTKIVNYFDKMFFSIFEPYKRPYNKCIRFCERLKQRSDLQSLTEYLKRFYVLA